MQSSQNSLGLFRVFKPTILFQAPQLPSMQPIFIKPELNVGLWNQSLGPLSYARAPPPTNGHVGANMRSESTYLPILGHHTTNYSANFIQSSPYQTSTAALLEQVEKECNNKEDNGKVDAATTTAPSLNCKSRKKKYPCPFCDVRCSNNGQLQGHLRIHTGEKPFRCNHEGCDRRFARNEELTRHKRIHSGFRPHKCETCQKAFGRKDHLNKHKKTHLQDAQKRVFVCTFRGCKQRYSRSDALTRHQCAVHAMPKATSTRSQCAVKAEKKHVI